MVTLPEKSKVPHITVFLSEGVSANDSKGLDFKVLNEFFKTREKFCYFIKDNGKEYISFETYIDCVKKL